jgi:hypothetical protein
MQVMGDTPTRIACGLTLDGHRDSRPCRSPHRYRAPRRVGTPARKRTAVCTDTCTSQHHVPGS